MAAGQTQTIVNNITSNRPLLIGIIVGVVLLIAGIILFAVNSGTPNAGNYRSLASKIEQSRAIEISAMLKAKGIDIDIQSSETGGTSLLVREKQYDEAILELAKNDLLNNEDFKLFDQTDWAASDYERRVKYMRAVSGELSRVLSRLKGIKNAKAQISIPAMKMFNSRYNKEVPSASIILELSPGYVLTDEQVASILSIVSGYVPEIQPSEISIVDTTSNQLFSSAIRSDENDMAGGGIAGFDLNSKASKVSRSIEKRVQAYLGELIGPGKSQVAVSVRLNSARLKRNTIDYYKGAIGKHEYSEEALGDPAKADAFQGMAQSGSPAGEAIAIDPRLTKDLDPSEMNNKLGSLPLPKPIPLDGVTPPMKQGLEQGARYTCADNDEACKRNYRNHNFAIESYPSSEQTVFERPAGDIIGLKVSVVLERGSLPASLGELKRAIAAAADPSVNPEDVEIILKAATPSEEEVAAIELKSKKAASGSSGLDQVLAYEVIGFPWWVLVIVLLVGFLAIALLGRIIDFIASLTKRVLNQNNNNMNYQPQPNTGFPPAPAETNPFNVQGPSRQTRRGGGFNPNAGFGGAGGGESGVSFGDDEDDDFDIPDEFPVRPAPSRSPVAQAPRPTRPRMNVDDR